MTEDKTFALPCKADMLRRLLEVDDNAYIKERFYPLLIEHAGEKKNAMGVVLMLQLAIHDYTRAMAVLLDMQMNDYIDALCPDENIAKQSKLFFEVCLNSR